MANLLEGLKFPVTKENIRDHLNRKSPSMGTRINDVLEAIENNLDKGVEYDNAYDIALAAGLVRQAGGEKEKEYPHDRAFNKANSKRMGEEILSDQHTGRETIGPANSRYVSPNTPKGEDV